MNKKVLTYVFIITILTAGCLQEENSKLDNAKKIQENFINLAGSTIEERYLPPKGYERVPFDPDSFSVFLRKQTLKPYGEKVLYYNGKTKNPEGIYDSAFDVDIGERDLHQCADATMLLRAEYLYSRELYDALHFNFTSGFNAEYIKWKQGYRIKVEGNNVFYYKATEPSNTYQSFRAYMTMVMAYAGTLSLEQEMQPIKIEDMEIGDVFIVGGSPGHAVIIVDLAENQEGEKTFLLAQSYMPAQQTQLLVNPMDKVLSPWYSLQGKDKLITPEWTFELDTLRRF